MQYTYIYIYRMFSELTENQSLIKKLKLQRFDVYNILVSILYI